MWSFTMCKTKQETLWLELVCLCKMYISATKNMKTEPWNNNIACHELTLQIYKWLILMYNICRLCRKTTTPHGDIHATTKLEPKQTGPFYKNCCMNFPEKWQLLYLTYEDLHQPRQPTSSSNTMFALLKPIRH